MKALNLSWCQIRKKKEKRGRLFFVGLVQIFFSSVVKGKAFFGLKNIFGPPGGKTGIARKRFEKGVDLVSYLDTHDV